jgi:hypothetical protein
MRAKSARFFVPFFVWLCLGSLGLVARTLGQTSTRCVPLVFSLMYLTTFCVL